MELIIIPIKYDNIFDAITDKIEEAKELQARANLIITIRDIVNNKGWDQIAVTNKFAQIN